MTHRLTTNYAKNYCNRTLIVKVIVENVVTCFLGDTVYLYSVLGQRVYRTRIRDISHLKTRLVEQLQKFDLKIIDWAISQWRLRLRSCIQQEGGHFEHRL